MKHPARGWLSLCAAVVLSAVVSAHDVPVEQRVDMTVQPLGSRLVVRMHIPRTLLGDATPQMIAADVSRNLDLRQYDTPLSAQAQNATFTADRQSVAVELIYQIDAAAQGLSARLNGFQTAPLEPVRTIARYEPPGGTAQIISLSGPATRVRFDPRALEVLQLAITRGLSTLLTLGDHLLMLVCVLLPVRSARDARRLVTAIVAGQAAGLAAAAIVPGLNGPWVVAASMTAASCIVIAAVQNLVSVRVVLTVALAAGFGVLNGVALGETLDAARQLAGSHHTIAAAGFTAVMMLGQGWLAAVLWATRAWLDRQGVPERIVAIGASAVIAHTAVHAVVDRGTVFATLLPGVADHALVWLTLAWAVVMLVFAAVEALRPRSVSLA